MNTVLLRTTSFAAVCLLVAAQFASGQTAPGPSTQSGNGGVSATNGTNGTNGTNDAPALIGLQLYQVFARFGAPSEVYPIRGDKAWQDDVVFYYSDHLYLYWYDNRVWQVRFDRYFEGSFLGLSMGASISSVTSALGAPTAAKDDWVIYQLPDRGFPVRLRLFFQDGTLADAYIYRSDF